VFDMRGITRGTKSRILMGNLACGAAAVLPKPLVESRCDDEGLPRIEKVVSPTFHRLPNPKRVGGGSTRPQTIAGVNLLASVSRRHAADHELRL
jgi:hypothetical protein